MRPLASLFLAAAFLGGCVHMPDVGPKLTATGPWPKLAPLADLRQAAETDKDTATSAQSDSLAQRAAALNARAAALKAQGNIDPATLKKLSTPIAPVQTP